MRDDLEKANAESARLREQLSGLETKLAEATAAAEADRASAAESAAAEVSAVKDKLKKAIEKGKGLQKEKQAAETRLAEREAELADTRDALETRRARLHPSRRNPPPPPSAPCAPCGMTSRRPTPSLPACASS